MKCPTNVEPSRRQSRRGGVMGRARRWPEGMENNDLNEYLFQHWIQNQAWFPGPPTRRVVEQSPALKKEAPCPVAQEAELVLSFQAHSLRLLPLAGRSLRGRKGDVQGSGGSCSLAPEASWQGRKSFPITLKHRWD